MGFTGIAAVIFDAYGTLFDVHGPAQRLAPRIGPQADALSRLWRQKQVEYTWLRSLMRAHADFAQVTADALDYALASHGIADEALRADLLALYDRLPAYPDAAPALAAIAARGLRTAILSNGTPAMLGTAVTAAGLAEYFDEIISVEEVGIYKPDPRVYQRGLDRFGLRDPRQVLFVSANPWDAQGAAHFGFLSVRVDRFGLRDEMLPEKPKRLVSSLSEIPDLLTPA